MNFRAGLPGQDQIGYIKADMIITIDGPAGSGKSTAARLLAKTLGIAYLDTGATYRALTLAAMQQGLDLTNEAALAELAGRLDLHMAPAETGTVMVLDGRDVSAEIRSVEVTDKAHYAADSPAVRAVLVALQRRIGEELARRSGGVVAEGRDQGTVVFPDADVKFYLDASPEVRARRRYEELAARGEDVSLQQVLEAIRRRDRRDRSRSAGPLAKPPGAIEIDTSEMTVEQMVGELVSWVRRAR